MDEKEVALRPLKVISNPGKNYYPENRKWQGIPGVERAKNGLLWACWYSGGNKEPEPENYALLVNSEDDGNSWSNPILVVEPSNKVRSFDPVLWHDPLGRLWFFWNQSFDGYDGRCGVWAITTTQSHKRNPNWTKPKRLCDGIIMNKPLATSYGEWLLPAAIWGREPKLREFEEIRRPNVYSSRDNGKTWILKGGVNNICGRSRVADEHMLVERKDGSLWMLIRTSYGIGESFSYDKGKTWSEVQNSNIGGPDSRFFIRRLKSEKLLLINHYNFTGRSHLTAFISTDEGKSWHGHLLLDERENVSYPDAVQAENGIIYAVYDRERYKEAEILMVRFTEEEAVNGKFNCESEAKKVISKLK